MNCKLSSCFSSRATLFCLFLACKILSLVKYYPPLVLAAKIKRISIFVLRDNCLPSWLEQKQILDYVINCTLCLLQSNSALQQQSAYESDALCNSDWSVETFLLYSFYPLCMSLKIRTLKTTGTIWNIFIRPNLLPCLPNALLSGPRFLFVRKSDDLLWHTDPGILSFPTF